MQSEFVHDDKVKRHQIVWLGPDDESPMENHHNLELAVDESPAVPVFYVPHLMSQVYGTTSNQQACRRYMESYLKSGTE